AIQFEDLQSEFIDQNQESDMAVQQVAEQNTQEKGTDPQVEELERLRAEVAELKRVQQETQFNEYLNSLGGKVAPGEKPGLIALMASLAGDSQIFFAEGGATKSQTALEVFKKSLESREVKISFQESPNGVEPNSDPVAVAEQAAEYVQQQKAKGNSISFAEAVIKVQKGAQK
ncbi:MAG: hypothetical protein SFT94_02245, partial [Pseudanabaenaceae cyanobacterium bins.68]|nr:hypothetical protein [Pseudanabaenaceae cyanobacterium bins.68]